MDSRETDGFILIDRESFETVGMGLVSGPKTSEPESEKTRLPAVVNLIRGAGIRMASGLPAAAFTFGRRGNA